MKSDNLRPIVKPFGAGLPEKILVIGEIHPAPTDIVRILRDNDMLDKFSEGELMDASRSLTSELNFRRTMRANSRPRYSSGTL